MHLNLKVFTSKQRAKLNNVHQINNIDVFCSFQKRNYYNFVLILFLHGDIHCFWDYMTNESSSLKLTTSVTFKSKRPL